MNSPEFDDPTEGLGNFFDYFWGNTEGVAYLPVKERQGDSIEWKKYAFPWPKYRAAIIQHALANSAEGKDVYFGPALYKPDAIETKTVGQKEGILGSQVLWTDYDGNAPEYSTSYPSEGVQEPPTFADGPLQGQPAPTLRVQSSQPGHEHFYWKLEEWCGQVEIEARNRSLAYLSKADTGGWDINQVLRPPHTSNWKIKENPRPVEVKFFTETTVSPNKFTLPSFKTIVQEVEIGDIPEVERIIAKYAWDEKHFDLFMDKEIPEGERSSALMRIGFFGAEKGMSNEEIYSLLVNADDRWGKFKNRNDRHRRLLDIVNKARLKYPHGKDSIEFVGAGLLQSAKIEETPSYAYGFKDFLETNIHIEWAVEGLVEITGLSMITGSSGVGKTGWAFQLAIHMSLGRDFLGWKVTRPLKMLFLQLEMNHEALKFFGETIATNYSEDEIQKLQRNLIISPLGRPIGFDRPEGKKFVETLIEQIKPDGILIDSLGKTTVGELGEAKVKELNEYFNYLRNKHRCFIMFIHHNRKANGENKKPNDLADLYGSQYIAAEASSVIGLWRDKGEKHVIEVLPLKTRLREELDPFKIRRSSSLSFEVIEDNLPVGLLNTVEATKKSSPGENPNGSIFNI